MISAMARGPGNPRANAVAYAPITDPTAMARREVTAVANCNVCHQQLNGHGNNRVDSVQACSSATIRTPPTWLRAWRSASRRRAPDPTDKFAEQPMDLKVMIHAIHAERAAHG